MKTLILLSFFILVACAPKEVIKPVFKVPARPHLTTIPGEQLTCLSDETFALLLKREQQRRKYAEDLEAIVKECAK